MVKPTIKPDSKSNFDTRRLGGELPAGCDRVRGPAAWRRNWLPFSHGRAAFAWLLKQYPVRSALVCAYTCPTVPQFFRRRGLTVATFDVGASMEDMLARSQELPAPRAVVIPALFGGKPWIDVSKTKKMLDPADILIIDAAQTAFDHIIYPSAERMFALSCPRKTTSLDDGAVLAVPTDLAKAARIERLPTASAAAALKRAARALWATGEPDLENAALDYNLRSERQWPDAPHRMTDESLALLSMLDQAWHRKLRKRNYQALTKALRGRVPFWNIRGGTPFCAPIFVHDRKKTLAYLHSQRIFASPLWPDAEFSTAANPAAAWISRHLISIPIDQRQGPVETQSIARAIKKVATSPSRPAPSEIANYIR